PHSCDCVLETLECALLACLHARRVSEPRRRQRPKRCHGGPHSCRVDHVLHCRLSSSVGITIISPSLTDTIHLTPSVCNGCNLHGRNRNACHVTVVKLFRKNVTTDPSSHRQRNPA